MPSLAQVTLFLLATLRCNIRALLEKLMVTVTLVVTVIFLKPMYQQAGKANV
jgi:hypothetical protein